MLRRITVLMIVAYSLIDSTRFTPDDWHFWGYWLIAMVGVAMAGWELGDATRARKESKELKKDDYHEPSPSEGLVMVTPIASAALLPESPDDEKDALIRANLSMALMDASQAGLKKYGTPLYTHNGRDARRDAVQELVDLVQYTIQNNIERGGVDWTLLRAIEILPEIVLRADYICDKHGVYDVVDREDAYLKLRSVLQESRQIIRMAQNAKPTRTSGDRVDSGAAADDQGSAGCRDDRGPDEEDSGNNGGGTVH